MATNQQINLEETSMWLEVSAELLPLVKKHVYHVAVKSHLGQEYDVIQDIIQETIVRTFIQMQRAERGEVPPVLSPLYFAKKVSHNHLLDIARKESRLVRPTNDVIVQERIIRESWFDSTEDVLDDIEKEPLFTIIARVIADLPKKRQRALLIDLALHTAFDEVISPLQRALDKEHINLAKYRNLLPKHPTKKEKQQYSSLLSQAYKSVKEDVRGYLQQDCSA
ncbi:MAG TPA: hypothetical protein DHW02_14830 [Ktedonobacter sp.]|nr:hypothetical protein [Ktedonobacter sp.]